MAKQLTNKQRAAYLFDPDRCPFCKSEEIRAGSADFQHNYCLRDIECRKCGEEFVEYFEMISIHSDADEIVFTFEIPDENLTEYETHFVNDQESETNMWINL